MIKIEDIAKLAGVSTATVSRVLNNVGNVAPATREAVLNASRQLGRALDPEITRKRVLIIHTPSAHAMVEAFMHCADTYNISLLFKAVHRHAFRAGDIDFDGDFDGVIVVDSVVEKDELQSLQQTTSVVQCRNYCGAEKECAVLVDDVMMGQMLTQHLIDTGKKRVAFVSMDPYMATRPHHIERTRGFHAALSMAGLTPAAYYDLVADGVLDQMRADAGDKWDAIIFPEPIIPLLDLHQMLQQDGFRIGEDISLASFNDNEYIQRLGITGTRQPEDALANGTLFMLNSLMEQRLQLDKAMYLRYKPELLIRSSTTGQPE